MAFLQILCHETLALFLSRDWLRWTSGRGEMRVQVQDDAEALLHGELYSIRCPNTVDVIVNSRRIMSLDVNQEGFAPFGPIRLNLCQGENAIEVISHNPRPPHQQIIDHWQWR